jgi:hypothetical protein
VLALAFLAAVAGPITLGPFHPGQSLADATAAAARAGLSLRQDGRGGPTEGYWVLKGSEPLGSVGFCRGAVQSAHFNINGYDEFTTLLRLAIAKHGQPLVSFETQQLVDASRSLEIMAFKWPSRHYELEFFARQADGLYGFQSFSLATECH